MKQVAPEELAFDIDGVVTDTMGSFIRLARDEFGIGGLKKEQITSYWLDECLPVPEDVIDAVIRIILEDPWRAGLQLLPGAADTLGAIASVTELVFVTARPVKGPIEAWLRENLGLDRRLIKVVATGRHEAKAQVLKGLGRTAFVEDHLRTCRQLLEHGIRAVVFDQPWNRNGHFPGPRVRSWREIAAMVDV